MTTPTIDFNSGLSFAGTQRVYTRKRWADSWTLDDRLHCTQATWTAQPSIPTAQLVYAYGPALERNATTKTIRPKLNLGGWFVKVEFDCEDGTRKWYGYVDDDADNQGGTIVDTDLDSNPIPGGYQTFSCVGIIMALAHAPVIETEFTVVNMSLTTNASSETVRARSGPRFNTISINNEPIKDRDLTRFFWRGIYGFTDASVTNDSGGVKSWSTLDICSYLLDKCQPVDEAGDIKIPFGWVSLGNLPDHDAPAIDTDGMTLLQVFDRLINSSKSIGYYAYVDDDNTVALKVFTTTKNDIYGSDGLTLIPSNPNQLHILALADQATAVSVQRNQSQFANQLVVRGAKRVVVCTLPMEISISTAFTHRFVAFQEAWTNEEQTALDDELTAIDAMGLDPYQTVDKKNEVLNSPRYHHIGRYYRLRHNWRWAISDLPGVPHNVFTPSLTPVSIFVQDSVYPSPEPDQSLNVTDDRYFPFPRSLRILPHLPFKVGFDYSDDATPDTDFDEVNLTTSVKAYRNLFVFGQQLKSDLTYEDYKYWDWSTQHTRKYQLSLNQPTFSIEAEPIPEYAGWGLALNVQGAPQSHLIYRVGDDALTPFDYHIPKIDVKSLAVTLAFEEDRYAEAVYPVIVPWTASKQVKPGLIVTTDDNTYTVTLEGTFSSTSPTHTSGEVLNGTAKLTWVSGRDALRKRVIDLGDTFKRITVLPGTVTEIDKEGTAKVSQTKYHLRNAVPLLEKIAKQMAQWYLVPRAVMRLSSSRASAVVDVGKFVDTLNPGTAHATTINTVITEVSISSQPGNGQSPPTLNFTAATAFGELDPLVWVPRKIPVNAPKPASGGMEQGTF